MCTALSRSVEAEWPKSIFLCDLDVYLRSLRTPILHVKTRAKKAAPDLDCEPLILALLLDKKQLPPAGRHVGRGRLGWAVEGVVWVGGLAGWLVGLAGLAGWLVGRWTVGRYTVYGRSVYGVSRPSKSILMDSSSQMTASNRFGPVRASILEGCLERFVDFHVQACQF